MKAAVSHRKPISFSDWTPKRVDNAISYIYVNPVTGRLCRVFGDRWMRAKYRIASSAIASGQTEFTVYGGTGNRRWQRLVTVTQEEADLFFLDSIQAGHFTLKGEYRRACSIRSRRLEEVSS